MRRFNRLFLDVRALGLVPLIIVLSAVGLLAGCAARPVAPAAPTLPSGSQTAPTTDPGATLPGSTAEDQLAPGVLRNYGDPPLSPQGTIELAVHRNTAHSLQLRWNRHLDLAQAKRLLSVTPTAAVDHVDWDQGSSGGRDWAMASLSFKNPTPGDAIDVRLAAGLRGDDGSVLAEDIAFKIRFVEATRLEITLTGPGYMPGGTIVASSMDSADSPAILRPGQAKLDFTFSQPVDRQKTWGLIAAQLHRTDPANQADQVVALEQPQWAADNRHLTVKLRQAIPQGQGANAYRELGLNLAELLDARGLPLEPEHAVLRWFVADLLPVYRSVGTAADAQPAAKIAALPFLRPAGPGTLRGGLLLTLHIAGGDGADSYAFQPVVWNLAAGTGVPLGKPQLAYTVTKAQWLPDGSVLLVRDGDVLRFPFDPAAAFGSGASHSASTGGAASEPQRLFAPPEGRFLVGAALATDGRLALFEAQPAPGNRGHVDLLLLSPEGKLLQRVGNVSDLVANEGFWRTVEAEWSPDGSTLAFLPYRQGDWAGKAHLTLWRDGSLAEPGRTAGALAWRPGTSQLLLREADGWVLFDTVAGKLASAPGGLPSAALTWFAIWSPDGRYVLFPADSQTTVLDVETGKSRRGAFLALGWGENDELYWIAAN
ncbi:MAG: hypothetical protein ACYC5Y_04535 [Symbiobacteriia bacterium]